MLQVPTAVSQASGAASQARPAGVDRGLWLFLLAACALIVGTKLLLIERINVNWDEFFFLSLVHAGVRGELDLVFQTAYTHLFAWLPGVGDEMQQIVRARALLWVLFAVTAFLIARLASRWIGPAFVWLAPLCFVAASPVLRHGGEFRADSLLVPLMMAVLVLVTRRPLTHRACLAAGVCLGVAGAITVKAVFVAPIAGALLLACAQEPGRRPADWLRPVLVRLVVLGVVAAIVAVAVLLMHRASLPAGAVEQAQTFVGNSVRKTLVDVPFLPRARYLVATLMRDKVTWLLIFIGAYAAISRRNWAVLACGLSLLPVFFYRNAYPYYYVVMLAPACVLGAFGAQALREWANVKLAPSTARWVPLAICVPLLVQAAANLSSLMPDGQSRQRATIAAVHRIFPQPVPYIDHSGMIASFRKVNFFMSTWGVEKYRERGVSFMREALKRHRPPLLLINREELLPGTPRFAELLPEDQQLMLQFYVPYWGPVRVAGTRVQLDSAEPAQTRVPFPGRYRLEAASPVLVDGVEVAPGESVEITNESVAVSVIPGNEVTEPVRVQLVWAAAAAPPEEPPPRFPLYRAF